MRYRTLGMSSKRMKRKDFSLRFPVCCNTSRKYDPKDVKDDHKDLKIDHKGLKRSIIAFKFWLCNGLIC